MYDKAASQSRSLNVLPRPPLTFWIQEFGNLIAVPTFKENSWLEFRHSEFNSLEFWCSEYFKCLESWYSEFGCLESTHSEFEWLEFPHSELIWILCVLHARISVLFIFSGYGKMSQNVWKRTTWNLLPALNTRYFHNVKIVHLANHNRHRNSNEPIKFWSKYL